MKKIIRFIPALLWMVFIFFLSTRQTSGVITSDPTFHFYIFKTFHLIEYTILALLLFFGFKNIRHTLIASYLYALSDEIHQYFVPGRSPALRDTLIDVFGITLGLILIQLIPSLLFHSHRRRK